MRLYFLIAMIFSTSAYSQLLPPRLTKHQKDSVFRCLMEKRANAEFPYLYDKLTMKSKVIRYTYVALTDVESYTFDKAIDSFLVVDGMSYWFYNDKPKPFSWIAESTYSDTAICEDLIYPAFGETDLKYFACLKKQVKDWDDVVLLSVFGGRVGFIAYKQKVYGVTDEGKLMEVKEYILKEFGSLENFIKIVSPDSTKRKDR